MSTYYLNAASTVETGLTPEEGYHSLAALIDNVSEIVDGDVVKLVAGATIEEPNLGSALVIPVALEICSWEGSSERPEWLLPEYDLSAESSIIFYGSGPAVCSIHDISIIGRSSGTFQYSTLSVYEELALLLTRCLLTTVQIKPHYAVGATPVDIRIINNIFKGMPRDTDVNNAGCIQLHAFNGTYNGIIINNTFYDGAMGIALYENVQGKILNNIFLHQGNVCIYRDPAEGYTTDVDVDNNVTFGWEGSGDFLNLDAYIGENNKRGVDPILSDPEEDDFNPTGESPCFLSGIGFNAEEEVPVIDYNSASRSSDSVTIGALNGSSSPSGSTIPSTPITVDAVSIPLFDNGSFSETVSLDGNNYGISLSWNARAGAWFMSIADGNGAMLRTGIRLNISYPLKMQYNDAALPQGDFLLVDKNEETWKQEAGRDDFVSGRKLELWYLPKTA